MKKSRIIALLTAVAMIMSVVPAYAAGFFVDEEGAVYEMSGENLVSNPGFEEGLTGITSNDEYYEVSSEHVHSGAYSLKAIKSTKGEGAITAYFAVEDPADSYYLSFWYKNTDVVARRPRVTFAFTDSSKTVPTVEDDFTEMTNAWIKAGTASNDQDMAYSMGDWVQYSTVIKGTGESAACAYVVLNIYGLTKDNAYVDDFEVYALSYSDEYGDAMTDAIAEWGKKTVPGGPLAGVGTLSLPREVKADGILVEWTSSNEEIINAETGEYQSGADEELVILTARLYAEGLYDEVYFEYTYPYIVRSMFDPYIEWIQTDVFKPIGTAVSGNINLPATHSIKGYPDAEITWSCSEDGVIAPDGTFTAPDVTCYVDLTATITCSGSSATTTTRIKAIGGNLIPEGLEMYYDFETAIKNNKVYDNAQKAYNATADGITIENGYASINGTIVLPSNYPSTLTGSYSVSMWVKLNSAITSSGAMYRFFDFGGGSYTSQFLRYVPGSGQLSFMDRELAGNGSNWAIDTTADIGKTGWSLVTLTYDMDNSSYAYVRVFVDGEEVGNSSGCTYLTRSIYQMNSSSTTGFIGQTQWDNADNPDLYGSIDDVRIYSRVLSDDEITTLFEETKPIVTAPVTIKFQDVEGNTLKDDVTIQAEVNTDYDVPASYKSLPSTSDEYNRITYTYISSKSIDSVSVSADAENVCILVFQKEYKPKSGNLIDNPSFESGVDGWTSNNNGTLATVTGWVRSNEQAHRGSWSLKRNANVGSADASNFGTYIPIESGKVYYFTFWEYCDSDVAAGSHQMSAVCVTENMSATNDYANHLVQYGGYSSWYNNANGATRDPAYYSGWTQREFVFDTTGATNANYIFVAYAWQAGSAFYIDDFYLKEGAEPPTEEELNGGEEEEEEDLTNKIPVIINYVDTDGNVIQDAATTYVAKGVNDYVVPDSYKKVEDLVEGSLVYKYTYNAEASKDTVSISILRDNVATLVFDVIKADKNSNLVTDGGFEDESGNFSWGTWQSPETQNYFKDVCEGWFYKVNRDTNASALYKESDIEAEDYALGTRWNDGTTGLCSMANFVPVEKGKTYIVSYDYKHQTAGTDGSYISTSFVTTKSMSAGAASGSNIPKNVSTDWQTNTFTITAPSDGYIYFHFSWLGSGGPSASSNSGSGPYWYFDNFEVLEVITFENKITYSAGYAEIVAEDGTEGYLVQAMYDEEGALTDVTISDKLTLSKETVTRVAVTKGAKLMLVKDLTSLKPLAPAIIAE